ncbi:hypothetical protein MCOR02_001002 [Pyricularia oryzae]|nr:hypothetical protein MCOR02_001002 [Pyricularia oryzae]
MFFITVRRHYFVYQRKQNNIQTNKKKTPKKPSPIHPSINKSGTGRLLLDEIILPAPEIDLRLAYSRTRAFTAVEKKDDDKNRRIRLINECLKRCIRSLQSLFLGATAKGARMDIFP